MSKGIISKLQSILDVYSVEGADQDKRPYKKKGIKKTKSDGTQPLDHPWRRKGNSAYNQTSSKSSFSKGLAKGKRYDFNSEEIDAEATRDYFENLYRNCKD